MDGPHRRPTPHLCPTGGGGGASADDCRTVRRDSEIKMLQNAHRSQLIFYTPEAGLKARNSAKAEPAPMEPVPPTDPTGRIAAEVLLDGGVWDNRGRSPAGANPLPPSSNREAGMGWDGTFRCCCFFCFFQSSPSRAAPPAWFGGHLPDFKENPPV